MGQWERPAQEQSAENPAQPRSRTYPPKWTDVQQPHTCAARQSCPIGCANRRPGGEEPGGHGHDRSSGPAQVCKARSRTYEATDTTRGALGASTGSAGFCRREPAAGGGLADRTRPARLEGHGSEVRGHGGARRSPTLLTRVEAGLTCTRVRMTSMGLVRTEAVAAARGPATAWKTMCGHSLGQRYDSCSGIEGKTRPQDVRRHAVGPQAASVPNEDEPSPASASSAPGTPVSSSWLLSEPTTLRAPRTLPEATLGPSPT